MSLSSARAAPALVLRAPRAVVIPLGLAVVYLVALIIRFPALIGWLNNNLDVGAAYVLATTLAHGHTGGHVVLGTQGAWVSLGWAVLTYGLPDHRVIWEVSPALASLACALVVGGTVSRLTGRAAGLLCVTLIVTASPTLLWILAAPWLHNTTFLGVALLGAYLVWLSIGSRSAPATAATAIVMSLVIGLFMASDQLLEPAGLVPFLLAPALLAIRAHDRRGLAPIIAVAAGATLVAAATNAGMHAAGYVTTVPQAHLDLSLAPRHLAWLIEGFARLGNGITTGSLGAARLPLTMAAALTDLVALLATARFTGTCIARPGTGSDRARALHVTFWSSTIFCSSVAYVLTGVATMPADRYVAVVVPAVAAIVPLLLNRPRAVVPVLVGASVFMLASIAGLTLGDDARVVNPAIGARQANRVAALAHRHHLGVGFAGYSDAGPLDWESRLRLHLHPVQMNGTDELVPSTTGAVAAWYHPRPGTPSYLGLSHDNEFLPDRVPPGLPRPDRVYRVGELTIAAWPFDIAADLNRRPDQRPH